MNNNATVYMEILSGNFSEHDLYFSVHHKLIFEDGKVVIPGKAFKKIDLAVKDATYWAQKGHDVYMAMNGQRDTKEVEVVSKTGSKFKYFKAIRKRYNISLCSSLYIDQDVKAGEYNSTNEAMAHLREFVKHTGLPIPTMIVKSGTGGLHSYWVADELFSSDEFFVLAPGLVKLAKEFGLKFDEQCTNDVCRLLRVPETWNFKTNPPLPVELLYSQSKIPLATLREKLNAGNVVYLRKPELDDNDELSRPSKSYALVDINQVAAICPFVHDTLASGGADQKEPIWKQAISIASFCINGRHYAHEMSKGHGAYSPEETDNKFDQVELDKRNNSKLGPAKCSYIDSIGVSQCNSCLYLTSGSSPVNLPSIINPQLISPAAISPATHNPNSDLPIGYYRKQDNKIYIDIDKESTEAFSYSITYNSAFAEGGEKEYQLVFTTQEGDGRDKIVKLPMACASDRTSLSVGLSKSGLPMMTTEVTRRFMTSFMSQLRSSDKTLILTSPLGWHNIPGKGVGFSYNGVCHFKGQTLKAQRLDGDLAKHYAVSGSEQPWRDLSDLIISQNRPQINAIIASGFAAPLMYFTGHTGAAIGIWSSKTGIGKSTGLAIAQAIFGSTIRMSGLNDTLNQTIDTMATLKNIAICWDELKGQKQIEQFAQIIFELSRGREKGRLDRFAHQMAQREFETFLIWTANQPLADEIANRVRGTAAGNYRMLEFNADDDFNSNLSVTQVSNLVGELRKNYGHIGSRYADYLGKHHDTLKDIIPKVRDHFEDILKGTQAERYYISTIACIYAAARISNSLMYTKFDLPSLKDFLIKIVEDSRSSVQKVGNTDLSKIMDTSLMIGELFHSLTQQTIKTDIVAQGPGRPKKGSVKVLNDNGNLVRQTIALQISKKPLLCRVADPAITKWCKDQGMPKSAFITALQKHFTATCSRSRIGSGTEYVSPPLLVWEINLTGTPLEQEIEF